MPSEKDGGRAQQPSKMFSGIEGLKTILLFLAIFAGAPLYEAYCEIRESEPMQKAIEEIRHTIFLQGYYTELVYRRLRSLLD